MHSVFGCQRCCRAASLSEPSSIITIHYIALSLSAMTAEVKIHKLLYYLAVRKSSLNLHDFFLEMIRKVTYKL